MSLSPGCPSSAGMYFHIHSSVSIHFNKSLITCLVLEDTVVNETDVVPGLKVVMI